MPAVSISQRRMAGADLARLRAGKKTKTGMTAKQLKDFASTSEKSLPLAKARLKKKTKMAGSVWHEPIVAGSEREESRMHKRVKEGGAIRQKGAYGEPVYLMKSKGDIPRSQRQAIEDVRREQLKRSIEEEKKKKRYLA